MTEVQTNIEEPLQFLGGLLEEVAKDLEGNKTSAAFLKICEVQEFARSSLPTVRREARNFLRAVLSLPNLSDPLLRSNVEAALEPLNTAKDDDDDVSTMEDTDLDREVHTV
ncbi:MAG: hypothetical protein Q7R81_05360 [Candidatus Peregrinibacteria bacterium]|nr:hypothetical protein [Candidatus Peregrinibacteria bacterium]